MTTTKLPLIKILDIYLGLRRARIHPDIARKMAEIASLKEIPQINFLARSYGRTIILN